MSRKHARLDADADEATIRAFLAAAEPEVLRNAVGLSWQSVDPAHMVQAVSPDAFVESDGSLSLGALAVLTDSTLGSAGSINGGLRFGATVGLRVELAGPLLVPPSPVMARASVVHADPSGCLSVGALTAPDGAALGFASIRCVAVDLGAAKLRSVPERVAPTVVAATSSATGSALVGVDDRLGVEVIEAVDGRSRLAVRAGSHLANGAGRLHGGIVAAIAHRGGRHAIASTLGDGEQFHDLVLDVDIVRPVPPGDVALEVQGSLQSRTRRFAWAESEVLLPDGRVAARGRVVAAIDARECDGARRRP